jgi:hypothetical protein
MATKISSNVSPTGGVVILNITYDPSISLATNQVAIYRYTGSLSSSAALIYSGLAAPVVVDDGEGLPSYLDYNTSYFYQVIDPSGITTTAGITPAAQINILSNYLDKLFFRLFSAGINSVVVPVGFPQITVMQAMPLTWGSELLPFVVMNLDLEQQSAIQIGEGVNTSTTNTWIIPRIVFRRYSISILTQNPQHRDFYKDACVGVVYSTINTLNQIAQDLTITYQLAQSQVTGDLKDPSFYETQIMVDVEGVFNTVVTTSFGIIQSIAPMVSGQVGNLSTTGHSPAPSGVITVFNF